ncbi:MAG: GatB/YqeY domain-containing protein [Alphaproteobacteria bacterium]|nr:GatB/YqeY domain-containing protein [Alphaproteobacteria bacterium]
MSLRETIMEALKDAMRARKEQETGTIRMIIAKMRERDIEVRPSGNMDGISDAEILSMMEGMVKQRRESITMYEKGARADLVAQETAEIAIIETFMPKKLSSDATQVAITEAIAATGATSIKDMGKVMNLLKEKYAGQLDFAQVGASIKARLSSAA